MRSTLSQLIARLSAHGLREPSHALRVATATALALEELLPEADARALFAALPPELSPPLVDEQYEAEVEAAIRAIAEMLPNDLVTRLRERLPPRVAGWLPVQPRVDAPLRSVGLLRTVHHRPRIER